MLRWCVMFSFNPTFNIGLGNRSSDKGKDALAPQPAAPTQQSAGPIQLELGDPVLLLMLTAIVILSSAVLVYAARH
jgi:hypothetical protein